MNWLEGCFLRPEKFTTYSGLCNRQYLISVSVSLWYVLHDSGELCNSSFIATCKQEVSSIPLNNDALKSIERA